MGSAVLKLLEDEKQKLWGIKFAANALKSQALNEVPVLVLGSVYRKMSLMPGSNIFRVSSPLLHTVSALPTEW